MRSAFNLKMDHFFYTSYPVSVASGKTLTTTLAGNPVFSSLTVEKVTKREHSPSDAGYSP